MALTILTILLVIGFVVTGILLVIDCLKHKEDFTKGKWVALAIIGIITNLLDTLGIGSFATTQFGFKLTDSCEDGLMPGTLNIGDTFPVIFEAILFLGFVEVETITLVTMIGAAVIGAWVGAGIVCKWNVNTIRYGLATAMLCLAVVMLCKNLGVGPFGLVGEALGLTGIKLIIAIIIQFFLGAFMCIGFGLYAPCTALVLVMGMNVGAAFPIMMCSCALLMPVASIKFIKEGKYDRKATICLGIFGLVGVALAYWVITSLPMNVILYVIIVVMVYTAIKFILDAKKDKAGSVKAD